MTHPKGWTNHIVLIVCHNARGHSGVLFVRYLMHGWGTLGYWIDNPTMADYNRVKKDHPEYDEAQFVFVENCRVCRKHLP